MRTMLPLLCLGFASLRLIDALASARLGGVLYKLDPTRGRARALAESNSSSATHTSHVYYCPKCSFNCKNGSSTPVLTSASVSLDHTIKQCLTSPGVGIKKEKKELLLCFTIFFPIKDVFIIM